jgi:hypothetical protein
VKPYHWAREASGAALPALCSTGGARSASHVGDVLQRGTLHSASPFSPQLSALSVNLQEERSPTMDALCASDIHLCLHAEQPP